ncbi:GIY-YIG nuclease family protein [Alkalinema sp. FACHB-956]|uniref:GIY-YIG nuclease family protein n=1 Tax=Alkalinema sp. FACHB-956 TaxID=2692768 RepID=UPI00168322C9|nr:GIY-YIG nuclease family protein [Alkalinema sp. FACHB-956]
MSINFVREEAERILDRFQSVPFDTCHVLTRQFETVPARTGIYGFRHRTDGLLYIGKATNIQRRLRSGHKALAWAFIDRLDPDDVRVVADILRFRAWQNMLDIEATMIQLSRPSYNIVIRQLED